MRTQFLLLSALSSLLMSGYPVLQSVRAEQLFLVQQQKWEKVSSSEGGFTVLMPVAPTQNRQTTDGNNVSLDANLFTASLEEGKVKYSVSYTNFPDAVAQLPSDFILDSLSSRFTNDRNLKLINQQDIRLEQYSGKEFKFEAPGDKIVKYRAYLVKQRLYQLTTEIPKNRESALSGDIEKFMTSFQLVK
ncbi:hypothetical protein [Allocoleopsis sp.]|uniref:hypothetical protein n=1 Tax=Allocoleopsis sp. TaxID=3088169 RepID=UPI002FD53BE6